MVEFSKKSAPVSAGDSVDWDADTVGRDEWRLVILSATPPPLLLSPVAFLSGGDYETCHRSTQKIKGGEEGTSLSVTRLLVVSRCPVRFHLRCN